MCVLLILCDIFNFCFLFVNLFLKKSPISPAGNGAFCCPSGTRSALKIRSSVLSLAHPGLDLSAHRAELSVINTLFSLSGRDVVAYGTVAVDVIDIALRRMIGATFLGHHNTPCKCIFSLASSNKYEGKQHDKIKIKARPLIK
jgi:hypothetical protein